MSVYADTNMLARILLNDIPEQTVIAGGWIGAHEPGEIIVLDAVFVELFFIVESRSHYHLPRQKSVIFFKALIRIPQLHISDAARAAFELFKAHPKLDFMDCLLAASAEKKADRLLTFDKGLQKILN
jgi:predicted nucleic-acid-binding protein